MDRTAVLRQRLATQGVSAPAFDSPVEAVRFLGAVQSQELADARWSVGQRVRDCVDADVQAALDAGDVLRTHVLRPTWHFVARDDIRWLLAATAHRIRALNAAYDRQEGLDDHVMGRSQELVHDAIAGGRSLTRVELAAVLAGNGIEVSGRRLVHVVMRCELDGVICSGPRRGSTETYALVSERAPDAVVLERDEAVAQLARVFFSGHGPASVRDLARWSSLSLTEARAGLEAVAPELVGETVGGVEQWWHPAAVAPDRTVERGYLLPGYDEAFAAYPTLGLGEGVAAHGMTVDALYYRPLVVGIELVGLWRRDVTARRIAVQTHDVVRLLAGQRDALHEAAARYGAFSSREVTVSGLG